MFLALLISFAIQVVFFTLAAWKKTDKVTDLSYGLTFILIALFLAFRHPVLSPVQLLATLMVTTWGIRLAAYLFIRILKTKKDVRFDGIRENFKKFATFWFFQAISVWVIMLPTIVLLTKTVTIKLFPITIVGFFVWLAGLTLETTADWQQYTFKSKPANKNKWIQTGVWRYSRHPNYFGEMLCWWGIYLLAWSYLAYLQKLTIFGPLYITFILLFVSGIPPLEKRHEQKYGQNPDYRQYKKNTSALIPWPPKKS